MSMSMKDEDEDEDEDVCEDGINNCEEKNGVGSGEERIQS